MFEECWEKNQDIGESWGEVKYLSHVNMRSLEPHEAKYQQVVASLFLSLGEAKETRETSFPPSQSGTLTVFCCNCWPLGVETVCGAAAIQDSLIPRPDPQQGKKCTNAFEVFQEPSTLEQKSSSKEMQCSVNPLSVPTHKKRLSGTNKCISKLQNAVDGLRDGIAIIENQINNLEDQVEQYLNEGEKSQSQGNHEKNRDFKRIISFRKRKGSTEERK